MTAKKEDTKEVVAAGATALATVGGAALPAHLQADIQNVAGLGNSQDSRDSVMPFLAILQKGSPQVNEEESKYIDGAKAGMLLNTATGQIYSGKEGILVIPCGFQKNFVEWKPNRQGWAGSHPFNVDHIKRLGAQKKTVKVDGKDRTSIVLPNGNILTETAYTFITVDGTPMVIGAASTALGPMRQWMSYRRSQKLPNRTELPSFGKQYRLTTVYEKNDAGDWYNWKFTDEGFVLDAGAYEEAKAFAIAIAKGEASVGRPDDFESGDDDGVRGTADDDIPV